MAEKRVKKKTAIEYAIINTRNRGRETIEFGVHLQLVANAADRGLALRKAIEHLAFIHPCQCVSDSCIKCQVRELACEGAMKGTDR